MRRALVMLLLILPVAAWADEAMVPAQRQVAILLKALSYDYKLGRHGSDALRVGIVYAGGSPGSAEVAGEIEAAFAQTAELRIQGMPIRTILVEERGAAELRAVVQRERLTTLYFAPGLDDALPALLDVSREARLDTITGVSRYVERGVAIGVRLVDRFPKLMVNLHSADAHGQQLATSVLKISELVR